MWNMEDKYVEVRPGDLQPPEKAVASREKAIAAARAYLGTKWILLKKVTRKESHDQSKANTLAQTLSAGMASDVLSGRSTGAAPHWRENPPRGDSDRSSGSGS